MKYICTDCDEKIDDYDDMVSHVRNIHHREPKTGRDLGVGSILLNEGKKVCVLRINEDGSLLVRPIAPLKVTMEYRVDKGSWDYAGVRP